MADILQLVQTILCEPTPKFDCFPSAAKSAGNATTCLTSSSRPRQSSASLRPSAVLLPSAAKSAGNKAADILQLLPLLAPHYEQTVLLGYPPFLKGVVDAGVAC